MKNIIQILVLISISSCKEEPNYNPFDNQFNVSVMSLIRNNCDTISAGCGYFNLSKREGKLKPYYQIYDEDFYKVVAKGFTYEIDTFRIKGFKNIYADETRIDSIINLPINQSELNEEFGRFGYKINSRNMDTIQIVNIEKNDTIELDLEAFPIHINRSIVRGIGYFKTKKKKTKR